MICFVCFCVCLRHSYCGFYSQTRLTENGLKVVTCCQRDVPFNRYLLRQLGLWDILQPAQGSLSNYLLNIAKRGTIFFLILKTKSASSTLRTVAVNLVLFSNAFRLFVVDFFKTSSLQIFISHSWQPLRELEIPNLFLTLQKKIWKKKKICLFLLANPVKTLLSLAHVIAANYGLWIQAFRIYATKRIGE